MARSISEQFSLMIAIVIAAPVAFAGLDMLLFGGEQTWGAVLIAFAAAVLLVEKYVTTPHDLPGMAASKAVGFVAKAPDEDADANDADS